jgi:cytochrome c biogenesis protein CcdA
MEIVNLSLVFSAGLIAVLAPCALPMIPSFVSYYMNAEGRENNLRSALSFGFITVAGFLTVFLAIGILPSFAINSIASKINLISPFIGVILIVLGLIHAFSDIFYKIPVIDTASPKGTGYKAFYLYGLGYGAASMGCSFPVFVLLVLQTATASGISSIIVMFLAYGLGVATVLVPLSVALTFGKEFVYQRLMIIIPHMKKINAAILIIAGAYMVYYGLS